ncbi:SusC/RagA family TonB-linked outer membrane protein [Pedobacter sp. JCM 36344]|uniref:SusC/RagA family TonB-linked outer membrane protein n=1 Tax=Pedobacter sp. JCM 36344 TaxID=3374280 RepID=UPI00397BCF04
MRIKLLFSTVMLLICTLSLRTYAGASGGTIGDVLKRGYLFQQDTTKKAVPATTPQPVAVPQDTIKGKVITGIVVDEKSLPLPGVGVKTASNKTTVTDGTGKFAISTTSPTERITFSYIGYAPVTRVAGAGRAPLSIRLAPAEGETLQDVQIVAVGYGTLDKREVTSAVAHLDSADFRQSGSRNPLDLIQGKVAGLQITRTGGSNPNSGVGIQLRGITSVTGSQSPLIVIDGIPGGNLDLLQQDDIQSMDVLKDGSGAAIYGTRANAGVILITTKKGRSGPAKFDYSSYVRHESLYQRPDFMTAEQMRARITSGELDRKDYGNTSDFFNDLVNSNNISQNHNLAISGGSDNTSYRASLNYRDLQGFAKENNREEYGIRLNLNQKGFDNKLNLSTNLTTTFNKANLLGGGGFEDQFKRNPTLSNFNPDGSFYFENTSTNQFARLTQESNRRQQQTSSIDTKADFEILKGLKASLFGAIQRNSYIDGEYRAVNGEYSIENDIYKGGGYARRATVLEQNFNIEPTLEYRPTLGGDHSLTALAGYSYRYEVFEGFNASNLGFLNDLFEENNLNAGNQLAAGKAGLGSYKNDNTLIAFFGRLNYSYKGRYFAQAIYRREGSSRFGINNKWGDFPAFSAGWTISEEDFMKDSKVFSNLKLRAGYGITGNSGIGNYASLVTLGTGGVYLYPDGQYRETYGPNSNPNPDLRWEKKRELNIGLDFGLFTNKLSGSLDVFSRATRDLLDNYESPQPPYIRSNIYTNVGSISAKGIELTLSYAALKTQDFSWNIDFAGSTTANKLDSYSDENYKREYLSLGDIGGFGALGNAIRTYEGGKLGEFWGKRFAGFTDDGKWLFYNRAGEKVRNDQINNSFDRNTTDLVVIGNGIPKYYLSLANNFSYKKFDLRVFLRGKFGYDILNTTAISYGNKVSGDNLLNSSFDKYAQINDTYMYSDYYVENGSHLKIDEITLGYRFDLKSKFVRNLRVYATGQNLATITNYTGNDPDFVNDTGLAPGIDGRGPYPSTRSFLFGLNIGF